jgi:hypothetical protein
MIGVYIPASAMTVEQYKSVDAEVTADGVPDGLRLHTCFREGDALAIFDVWESQEAFEAFGAKLMPIVQAHGIAMSAPQFVEMVAFDLP